MLVERLQADGFRAELVDAHADSLGARIRRAKLEKVPYVLVVGDDDVEHGTVGVNRRGSDDPERGVRVDEFVARLAAEVAHARVTRDASSASGRAGAAAYIEGVANQPDPRVVPTSACSSGSRRRRPTPRAWCSPATSTRSR